MGIENGNGIGIIVDTGSSVKTKDVEFMFKGAEPWAFAIESLDLYRRAICFTKSELFYMKVLHITPHCRGKPEVRNRPPPALSSE
ncbi:hypothetical protein EVAR_70235_1 [Eumeta japonica]|uniref:Uncharacterized protein n=1 Tax=Eumeta variegata TaxID=151549 RepID=A0A4C1SV13_EUMVA|nr:hypothetical protein EVAR_70235_1 [Eumeta japonica]